MTTGPRTSAGLLPFRLRDGVLEVFIAHMGGPFWARRDDRAWSVVKGEYDPEQETALAAARREFAEELGLPPPAGEPVPLGEVRQSSKRVTAFAVEAPELDPDAIVTGTFAVEWPPRSGRLQHFAEVDRAAWFDAATARQKLVAAQAAFVDRLVVHIGLQR